MGRKRHKPEEIITKLRQVWTKKRLKDLETENTRLKAVSDLTLDKLIGLQEAAKGNF